MTRYLYTQEESIFAKEEKVLIIKYIDVTDLTESLINELTERDVIYGVQDSESSLLPAASAADVLYEEGEGSSSRG